MRGRHCFVAVPTTTQPVQTHLPNGQQMRLGCQQKRVGEVRICHRPALPVDFDPQEMSFVWLIDVATRNDAIGSIAKAEHVVLVKVLVQPGNIRLASINVVGSLNLHWVARRPREIQITAGIQCPLWVESGH